jgi:hypothetical protein
MAQQPILRLNHALDDSPHIAWVAAGEQLR